MRHLWLCCCSRDLLVRTTYESPHNTICIFIFPRPPSRMPSFHAASVPKLLVLSSSALASRWFHLTSQFMLNSSNGFKFCMSQHGLCFLLYGVPCTDRAKHVIRAAVRLRLGWVPLVSPKLFEFTITLQVPTSPYLFSFQSCWCLKIPAFFLIDCMNNLKSFSILNYFNRNQFGLNNKLFGLTALTDYIILQ
jgi:hypothetical protein